MKAITYTEYGKPDVLHIKDVATPTPQAHEILVKVQAASVNYGDLIARRFGEVSPSEFNMPGIFWLPARIEFGLNKPKNQILGSEFSGIIEAVGSNVQKFQVGDELFGYLGQKMGAYAEYICVSETDNIAHKPSNIGFEEAATISYGAIMALNLLKKGELQKKQKVLILGASGGIGSAAVQLAKQHFGAEVHGVCGTKRLAYVQSLGADKVFDYTKEDFTQNGEQYDLIVDILGRGNFAQSKQVLKENGRYLYVSFKMKQILQMLWTSMAGSKKVICALAPENKDDMVFIKTLIEEGKYKAIIDKTFPMAEAPAAHRYVEEGNKQGQIVITMTA